MADSKSWSWFKNGRAPGIKALKGPPKAENPSLISQANKQTRPITLARISMEKGK